MSHPPLPFDIAQIMIYLFWFFFAGLLIYLRREDKREGYPLEDADASARSLRDGFPAQPAPKTFLLPHGGTRERPVHWVPGEDRAPINAQPTGAWIGAPLEPVGDPLLAGVGPGSWANRPDQPDLTVDGHIKIVPLRADPSLALDPRDPDPRGKSVRGADGETAGTVTDIWVDRSERLFRYLELQVTGGQRVLLPINFSKVTSRGIVNVRSLLGSQFANVPKLRDPDSVTLLEEEKIMAYYGAGTLYANAERLGPVL
jgi:photosynthetic reaction center H subunit